MSKYNNYLTDDEKEIILKMYNDGHNTVSIGKYLNRSDSSIGRFLSKNGIKTRGNRCILTISDKEVIVQMYKEGKSGREILERFSDKVKSENTILSVVKKNMEVRKSAYREIKEDYFEKIDTEAKAYLLGIMLTDGNVHKLKRNTEQYLIQLQMIDKEVLELLKSELNLKNKISEDKRGKHICYTIGFQSNKIAKDLISHGVVVRKSLVAKLEGNVPEHLYRHYIRGVFDGDGTVFINKYGMLRFGFYGTKDIVNGVQEWLHIQTKMNRLKIFDKPSVSFVIYQGIKITKDFYDLMYKDANYYIKRKKNKFDEYLSANTEVTNKIS